MHLCKSYWCSMKKMLETYKKCKRRCMSKKMGYMPKNWRLALWLEQTTITSRTRQITIHRILRTLRILRTAQTAAQTTIRRTARTTTITTTNNLCWNRKRQGLSIRLCLFLCIFEPNSCVKCSFVRFYLTDVDNEYNIIKENIDEGTVCEQRLRKQIPEKKDENI